MAKLISLGKSVTSGERRMLKHLQKTLSDEYLVFGNPLISLGKFVREIDAIIISPEYKVFVVETKHLRGSVTGDEDTWLVNGNPLPGVINKVLHNAAILKAKIVTRFPQFKDLRVEAAVVLTCDQVDLRVSDERILQVTLRLSESKEFFTKKDKYARRFSYEALENILRSLFGDIQFNEMKNELHHTSSTAPLHQSSPNKMQHYVRLTGENGFERYYFDDTILGRNELRGLTGWQALDRCQLSLQFRQAHGVDLLPVDGVIQVDSRMISPGNKISLQVGTFLVELGGIRLNADIILEEAMQ